VETCSYRENSVYTCELDYKATSDAGINTEINPEKRQRSHKTLGVPTVLGQPN